MGKNLIGSFALDLEDRILGEKYLRQRLALEINLAYKQMRQEKLEFNNEERFQEEKSQLIV